MSASGAQRRMARACVASLLLVIGLFLQATAYAQTETTTGIRGVVRAESNGSVIAGARVLIRNEAVQVRREVLTDDEGRFIIYGLPPGIAYEVVAEAEGFRQSIN